MNWRPFISLLSFILIALILGVVGWITLSEMIRWAAPAVALAVISIGLGFNSLMIALHTERRTTELGAVLARIEGLQEEIQKEQTEQKEQKSSSSQIIPTLEVFSQFYLDYLNKQKGEDKK